MLYLKLFIKKNALLLLYIIYVITVLLSGYYFDDIYILIENFRNSAEIPEIIKDIDKKTIITSVEEKKLPFYDTKNPVAVSIIFLLIELAWIFSK